MAPPGDPRRRIGLSGSVLNVARIGAIHPAGNDRGGRVAVAVASAVSSSVALRAV